MITMSNGIINDKQIKEVAIAVHAISQNKKPAEVSEALKAKSLGQIANGNTSMNKSTRWLGSAFVGQRIDNSGGGTGTPSEARVAEVVNDFIQANCLTESGEQVSMTKLMNVVRSRLPAATTALEDDSDSSDLEDDTDSTTSAAAAQVMVSDNISVGVEAIPQWDSLSVEQVQAIAQVVVNEFAGVSLSDLQSTTEYTVLGTTKNCGMTLHKEHKLKGKITEPSLLVNAIGKGKDSTVSFESLYYLFQEGLFVATGIKKIASNNSNGFNALLNDMVAIFAKVRHNNPTLPVDKMMNAIHINVKRAMLVKHHKYDAEHNDSNILSEKVKKTSTPVKSTSKTAAAEFFDF